MDEEFEVDHENPIVINAADVENTVAYSLIAEAEKLNQVGKIIFTSKQNSYFWC